MDVVMPQLGETVAEGKVATWFKAPGDRVEVGENLFEIETDKVTMEVQALTSGVLSEIRVKSGETVPVGAVVAVIGESGSVALTGAPDDAPGKIAAPLSPRDPDVSGSLVTDAEVGNTRFRAGEDKEGGKTRVPNGGTFAIAPFAETRTPTQNYGRAAGPNGLKITPLARRLIAQSGIDLAGLADAAQAKGAWRIGKAEVEAALHQEAPREPGKIPGGPGENMPFNNIRRQTGERLAQAWRTIPHVFQAVEIDFGAVDKVRQAQKADFLARHGVALTYLPFIARAACIAIADFPRVNARLEGVGLTLRSEVNLGIAVDLSHNGLVVPVVRHADEMTAGGLARAIHRQVEKARLGKLTPDDFAGGTYTISNNGAFGTLFTAPIVNPPQVAILSTDAVRKRPVVLEGTGGDSIAIRPVGIVAQSFDHRAFDGAYSAAFLQRVKQVLETREWERELS
jgi:2-oxoglutarate dehydrogenase E2 component (dihydrolipoamide succinyltransferase)